MTFCHDDQFHDIIEILISSNTDHRLSTFCVDSKIHFTPIVFYIYKSGGIKYVGYDGITNYHLNILEKVGGGILDDSDIMNKFSTVPIDIH
ncbi:hypothetical protein C1645_832924 [Glomus cerebriforme]|uniref:Uncharacterized protein n=1 Tax=Glomus cerebriforme TaxID=658196 RepID=A0A397SH18_9GLOM|nr:hypothetical protein C1645_832924 [Glomus cerebriforme]